jgi:uncharacterized hydrophobic protein (TIGR00271 family)
MLVIIKELKMKQLTLIQSFLRYTDLVSDVDDYDKIHDNIENNVNFRGTNLWILVFAIIVASVGLNMNSTAVVIGAMLISPLMGPINGMGYSIATYDFLLFRKAVKNFSFAVLASLLASTLYFTISPISIAHSELLARTSPTIYDVIIALFGGLAGIVAIGSKHKGNVIPGVAIATALMPPLCTAGFGLATGQFNYFLGAIYLFTINTVFIAISSILISKILKFPIRGIVENVQKKTINRWIYIVITLVLVPSIYFGYNLVQNEKFVENSSKYVNSISVIEGNYLLKNKINPVDKSITLIYGGPSLSEMQKKNIIERALDFDLAKAKIEFQQGLSINQISLRSSEAENLKAEVNRLTLLLNEKEKFADSLARRLDFGRQIFNEIKMLYPQIISCAYAESLVYNNKTSNPEKVNIIVFKLQNKNLNNTNKTRIENWLKSRLKSEKVKAYYE